MKYWSLFLKLFHYSLARDMLYPANFFAEVVLSFLHIGVYFFTVTVIFSQISELAGWSKNEVMLLLGMMFFFRGIFLILFRNGLSEIADLIYLGNLDLILVKPISPIFLIGLFRIDFTAFPETLYGLVLIILSLVNSGYVVVNFSLLMALLVGACGIIVIFSVYLSLMSIYFWTLESNIEYLFSSLRIVGQYPLDIFSGLTKVFFTWFLPLSFLSYFPAKIILGKITELELVLIFIVTVIFALLSGKVWSFGLRSYTSASS